MVGILKHGCNTTGLVLLAILLYTPTLVYSQADVFSFRQDEGSSKENKLEEPPLDVTAGLFQGDVNPFSAPIKDAQNSGFSFFNDRSEEDDELNAQEEETATPTPAASIDAEALPDDDFLKMLQSQDPEIMDPDEDPVIKPVKDAPAPFRGVLLSMQAGRLDMAMKFARQYARYQAKMSSLQKKATKFATKALQLEGYAPLEPASEDPDYEGTEYHFEKGLENVDIPGSTSDDGAVEQLVLGQKAKEILEFGSRNEPFAVKKNREDNAPQSSETNGDGGSSPFDDFTLPEKEVRLKARRERSEVLPRDKNGEARVYFFFKKFDNNAAVMLPVIEKLYQLRKDDPNFGLVALTIDSISNSQAALMKGQYKLSFPIRSGTGLATSLGITKSPSIVIYAPSEEKGATEVGIRADTYLDELVNIVQGKPVGKST